VNYKIRTASQTPAYLQLYEFLRKDIAAGIYPFGSRLPSKRTVAEEIGVSVITVEHAVNLLCEEGYAEARERSGYYVIYRENDFQSIPENPGKITGKPELYRKPECQICTEPMKTEDSGAFPFNILARTVRKVLLDYGERLLERSPNHGCWELRREICSYLARSRSIRIDPTRVIVGSGAEYLYGLIAQMFGLGTTVALEDPSYEKIRKVYEASGLSCRMLSLKQEGIDSTELAGSDAAVLHVTPFHSFPTGISVNISKKLEYLKWAEEGNRFLVEDNYDSELTVSSKPEETLFSLSGGKNVIYLNTFTKTIAPSVRIGYMLLPDRLTERFNRKLGFYACSVPLLDQYVLAELLRSGDFERHLNRVRRKKRKGDRSAC